MYHTARCRSATRLTIATTTTPDKITSHALTNHQSGPEACHSEARHTAKAAVAAEIAARTPQPRADGAGTGFVWPGLRTVATTDVHSQAIATANMAIRML